MTDSDEPSDSPYRAPEASLGIPDQAAAISETAMRSLESSKPWMRIAGIALMVNGALTAAMALYMGWESVGGAGRGRFKSFSIGAILLLLLAFRIFQPGLRLMQSSLAITRAARSREERDIASALGRHQEFWKSLGIAFAILFLVFILLGAAIIR